MFQMNSMHYQILYFRDLVFGYHVPIMNQSLPLISEVRERQRTRHETYRIITL